MLKEGKENHTTMHQSLFAFPAVAKDQTPPPALPATIDGMHIEVWARINLHP